MQRHTGRLSIGLAAFAMLFAYGCIVVSTTNIQGQAVDQIARGQVLRVDLVIATDRTDLTAFDFRLQYDPARFNDPSCSGQIASHNYFSVGAPQVNGQVRFVHLLSFGSSSGTISSGTLIARCDFLVKTSAPTGATDLTTYLSSASTAPIAAGDVGQHVDLPNYTKTVTIL